MAGALSLEVQEAVLALEEDASFTIDKYCHTDSRASAASSSSSSTELVRLAVVERTRRKGLGVDVTGASVHVG